MPIELPPSFQPELEKPQATDPLVVLAEVELDRGGDGIPPVLFRATSWHQLLQWPFGSPDNEQWHPFPFRLSTIEQNREGDLPTVQLSVDNSTRVLMRFLLGSGGLQGNRVRIFAVPAVSLAIAWPNQEFTELAAEIATIEANSEAVTFTLERANWFDYQTPQDRYLAASCRFDYGSRECGAIVNSAAAFQRCRKTVDACAAIGADHRTRGLPVLHPRRFGGFPGIPTQR